MCCAGCTGIMTEDLLFCWLLGVTTEDVLCIVQVIQVLRQRTCVLFKSYDRSRVVCCAGSTGVTTEDVLFSRLKGC